jgi:hypothetical protein
VLHWHLRQAQAWGAVRAAAARGQNHTDTPRERERELGRDCAVEAPPAWLWHHARGSSQWLEAR